MTRVPERRIQEIKAKVDCPKNFACCAGGFEKLCRREVGRPDMPFEIDPLRCTQSSDQPCQMAEISGSSRCCRCPLRVYVATYLNNVAVLKGHGSASEDGDWDNGLGTR
jgi:hypothetical protein